MDYEIKLFNDYYHTFDMSKEVKIYDKYSHTMRVVNYAEEIARSLNLSDSDVTLAKICALFHDIGRFPEWAIYHTYDDSKAFDHGDKSYEILKSFNYDNPIVLKAVKYHNKYSIPDNLSDREALFAKITRDADKIDIMDRQGNYLTDDNYTCNKKILNAFKEHRELKNSDTLSSGSMNVALRCVAFIFDINFKKSFEIINQKNLVNKKLDMLYDKFKKDELLEIKDICDKYMEEMLIC